MNDNMKTGFHFCCWFFTRRRASPIERPGAGCDWISPGSAMAGFLSWIRHWTSRWRPKTIRH